MTRKSRWEIERAVEDLADGGDERTVRAWVEQLLADDGWGMAFQDPDREVLVATMNGAEVWLPPGEIPAWVERDALPVEVAP